MKKIVFIGGGGGVLNIAPGLRDDFDVTCILTTFDNGGSYGRLRYAYSNPLTGDVRRALSALSTNEWGALTEYRYEKGECKGHTFGNLLLATMFDLLKDGPATMDKLHKMFEVKGKVLPVSYDMSELVAELEDGTIINGETVIDEPHEKSDVAIKKVWLDPAPKVAQDVAEAITNADMIILGPGDIYCSVVPCLLLPEVRQAFIDSSARKVYFCNTITKYGQTNNFTASDHVKAVETYIQPNIIDAVVLNTSKVAPEVVKHHKNQHEILVEYDVENLQKAGYDVVSCELLDDKVHEKSEVDKLKRSKICFAPEKVNSLVHKLISVVGDRV